jgi:organic radical activating enzyme
MLGDFLYHTHSVCEHCFRHVPAEVYDRDGAVVIDKTCEHHGRSTVVALNHSEFYHQLQYNKQGHRYPSLDLIMFEVTDRCNLACPDCYHLPDNRSIDKPTFMLIDQIRNAGSGDFKVMFAGAEPTMRRDIVDCLQEVRSNIDNSLILFLTNGVKFSDLGFVKKLKHAGMDEAAIGLNHWSYQGTTVHQKQLQGITNLGKVGIRPDISYTLETYDHLVDVLEEIQQINAHNDVRIFRIRFGSDIGRTSAQKKLTLSDHFQQFVSTCESLSLAWSIENEDNNMYHVMINVSGIPIRLIQWPDVVNINLAELQTGPWCNFYSGPVTNFVHQVIMRDISVNKKINLPDTVPKQYTRQYWLDNKLYS